MPIFFPGVAGGTPAPYDQAKIDLSLFDLENDIGETVNLVYSMPEKTSELLNEVRRWRKEVEAKMPTINTN